MHTHLPAAGHRSLLPLYDPLTKLLGADAARAALLTQARLAPGQRVLDVGCGTGTLLVHAARTTTGLDLVGLDPDPDALERARRKTTRAGVSARLVQGSADALPFDDGAFDRVLSSFVLHHLPGATKTAMLREVRRVLAPGGTLHLLDFVPSDDAAPSGPAWRRLLSRRFAWNHRSRGNAPERIVALLDEAGLERAEHVTSDDGLFGRAGYFRARR